MTITVASCRDGGLFTDVQLLYPDTLTSDNIVRTNFPTMRAPMFQLNYKSSDLPTPTSTTPRQGTSSSLSDSSAKGGSISNGAIAGIAVGSFMAGLLALALAAWVILRHRRSRTRQAAPTAAIPHDLDDRAKSQQLRHEVVEAEGTPQAHELPAPVQVSELDTQRAH